MAARFEQTTLSVRQRKLPRRVSPTDVIDVEALRPLSFDAADNPDDVLHVHVFPEGSSIVLSVVTGRGTANFLMPVRMAREIGDGLLWTADHQPNGLKAKAS